MNFVYFVFSDSRTGEIAFVVSIGFFLFIYLRNKKEPSKKLVKIGIPLIVILCTMAVAFGGRQIMKTGYSQYYAAVMTERASEQNSGQKKPQVKPKDATAQREQNIQEDISNGRFALWQSAVEVWETSPVYGAGYATFVPYTKEHAPDTYAVNTGGSDYTSMHNTFFNTLAFQGTIGAVLFVLIALRILTYVYFPVVRSRGDEAAYLAAMMSCVGAVVVSMMFLLDGIYTNSPGSFVLWLFTGYMVRYAYHKRSEERK